MGMGEPPVAKFECLSCEYSDYRMSARKIGELIPGECPKCKGDMKVVSRGPPDWLVEPLRFVGKHFEISDFIVSKDRTEFEVTARDPKRSFRSLLTGAKRRGYLPVLRGREGELKLSMMNYRRIPRENIIINFLLFGATILTTFLVGYFLLFDQRLIYGMLFSGAIMFMLSTHELGHKIAARRHGVDSTLPYFIPGPTILGTFGAFIRIKSPIPTKEALVEMGASGPLLGFFVAIPLTLVGLALSSPTPEGALLPYTTPAFAMMQLVTFGHISSAVNLNPLAFAGWVMMIVTALNLMPAGQLDGGHVTRGLLSKEGHYNLTRLLGFSLLIFGLFLFSPLLWIWGFFILILFGGYHVGALDDVSKLGKHQRLLAIVALVVFLFCFPIPTA